MKALVVRNEDGRGFRPTPRGATVLRVWDVVSWIVAAVFFGTLLTQGSAPAWLYFAAAPFFIAPFLMAMFLSGRGPLGALLHYGRRSDGGGTPK